MSGLIDPFIRRLAQLGQLSDDDRHMLEAVPLVIRTIEAGRNLVRQGDEPVHCILIVEGFACRYRLLDDGRRQIMAFHIPGNFCDLQSLLPGPMDHSIGTLTPVTIGTIPHATVLEWIETRPGLARLLWWDTLIEAAVFREWVVNVGQRPATERVAHLLCELMTRLRVPGLASNDACDMPITASALGEATGLPTVRINRALEELRVRGLIKLGGGILVAPDWDSLKQAGGFNPNYLHQFATAA